MTADCAREYLEAAVDGRATVSVRARLALARAALRDGRHDDAVDHLNSALNHARRDRVVSLVEDARRAVEYGEPR